MLFFQTIEKDRRINQMKLHTPHALYTIFAANRHQIRFIFTTIFCIGCFNERQMEIYRITFRWESIEHLFAPKKTSNYGIWLFRRIMWMACTMALFFVVFDATGKVSLVEQWVVWRRTPKQTYCYRSKFEKFNNIEIRVATRKITNQTNSTDISSYQHN